MEGRTGVIEEAPKVKEGGKSERVQQVISLLSENQSVVIRGDVKTGKTTLARDTTDVLKQHQEVNPDNPISVYFTSAEVQQTLGAKPVTDGKTGVTFDKVPFYKELQANPGKNIIVIDEVSSREPVDGYWSKYLENPQNRFIILQHPNRINNGKWEELFHVSQNAVIKL